MRMKFTRDWYIPKNGEEIKALNCDAIAYLAPYAPYRAESLSRFQAVGFSGKRNKPDYNYTFKTEEQARKYIAEQFESRKRSKEFKAEQRAARNGVKASDHFKVGDLLRTSWGYDQTNVEFFKIVRVLDKSVEVVAIGGKHVPSEGCGPMSGYCTPDPNNVLSDAYECKHNGIKRVQTYDNGKSVYVRIHAHSSGYPVKAGESCYESWYA
jgi:hypothetical protein